MATSSLTRLVVVRHGETEWNLQGRLQNHLDSPLTPKGREQARCLGHRLRQERPDVLYTSDLGRAIQTADIIATKLSVPTIVCKGLREQALGDFEGLTWQQVKDTYPQEHGMYEVDRDYVVPGGGESFRMLYERVNSCLDRIVRQHPGQTVAVITHGGTLDMIFRRAAGISFSNFRCVRLPNASVNIFEVEHGHNWMIRLWGDVCHLSAVDEKVISLVDQ